MRTVGYVAIAVAVFAAMAAGMVLWDTTDSSADTRNYVVYYVLEDDRIDTEQYSIDCEGIYVTNSYVFFKSITAIDTVKLGTLPATENRVSRFTDTDLGDNGFVVNPEGGDVSGWFKEPGFVNRVSSDDTLASLDGDGDGIIYLYMKAAKVYDVHYEVRNFKTDGTPDTLNIHWYDGYYLEKTNPLYNQNRFEDVEYVVRLVEGQAVPDALPDSSVIFNPDSGDLIYLGLQYWAKVDGSYNMDTYNVDQRTVTWFLRDNVPDYPTITPGECTPVYPGLIADDSLDLDGDGTIVLYGTTHRTSGETPTFFVSVTYAQEDLQGRNYGDTGYDGFTDTFTLKLDARVSFGGNATQTDSYVLTLPSYTGFSYYNRIIYDTSAKYDATATVTVVGDEATISGCSINSKAETYSIGIVFVFHRQSVSISYTGEGSPYNLTGYYGRDLLIPSDFSSHTLYRWDVSNLHGSVWAHGDHYYYTVTEDDLSENSASITAVWQEDQDLTMYTVNYHSRVNDVTLVSDVVTANDYITLPMITYPGYAHLGWALLDPDMGIDYDTTTLVIYPGKTSFTPSTVSEEYKHVDPVHSNMISIELYAIWCTSYTIEFDGNGGSGSMDSIGPVLVNEYVTLPACGFTLNNYDFVGWATSPGGDAVYMDGASVMGLTTTAHGIVTLYAVWIHDTYFIVYDGNGSTSGTMPAQTVEPSSSITLEDNTYVRTGYNFSGWATSASGPVVYSDGARITPASSLSLFAVWTPITYYVEFNANGGTGSMSPLTMQYGQTQTLPVCTFSKDGSSFLGWSGSNGGSYTDAYPIINLTSTDGETIVLYAAWTLPYYVEFNANGGTGSMERSAAAIGVNYAVPENGFVYVSHNFLYWNTASNGSGATYYPGDTLLDAAASGETFTLYAIWYTYTYYVQFDANGGTGSMGTMTVSGGLAFTLTPNAFTNTGRTFLGWSTDPSATVPMYTDGMTVVDIGTGEDGETVTLYAVWSGKTVTFTLSNLRNSNGRSTSNISSTVAFGIELRTGDSCQLTLRGDGLQAVDHYTSGRNNYYLVYFTYNGEEYPYGSVITITDDMDGKTFAATYDQYRAVMTYHINIDGYDYTEESTMPLTISGWFNYKYSGSAPVSDNPFVTETDSKYSFLREEGYVFCFWSTEADDITEAQAPGTVKSVSNVSSIPSYDFYAVWVKMDVSEYYYTGSAITPDRFSYISGSYTERISALSAPSYLNNINAGTATMSCTLTQYISTNVSFIFTILPAEVTVTVHDASKYYGAQDPTFTGDEDCNTEAPLDVLWIVYSRSNAGTEDAGTYPGVLIATYTSNPNYTVTVTPAAFTISPALVTITVDDASKNYGSADPAFTGTAVCNTPASTSVLAISYYRTNAGVEAAGVYADVLSAHYTSNPNFSVTVVPGTFTIIQVAQDTVYYIIVHQNGSVDTDSETVPAGTPFTPKTVEPEAGCSFYEWLWVIYDGNTIASTTHVAYTRTLDSDDIRAGTYMALTAAGNSITFNANSNEATGSMAAQNFSDRTGTLSPNAFVRPGYVFMGWSKTSDGPVAYYDQTPMVLVSGLSTNAASNVLYAVWAPYTYTSDITWTMDGYIFSSNGSFLRTDSQASYAIITGEITAVISASWLQILSNEQGMKLYVEMTYGNIMFDHSSLSTLAATGEDVKFSIKPVNSAGRETFDIRNGGEIVVMYNITASYYDSGVKTYVHALGGTATVTVRNMSGGSSVAYVGDDGSQPVTVSSTVDTITFTTDHFSLYEITEETASEQPEGESASLLIVMAVIASVLTAAMFLLRSGRH